MTMLDTADDDVLTARTQRLDFNSSTGNVPQEVHVAANENLDEMSVEDLQRHQEEVDRKIHEKQAAEKKAVIDQIVNVVHTYDIPIDELVEALGGLKIKRKGVPAVQKYRDPATGVTWSGRGKEPAWIRGKKREKFLIP